MATGTRQNNTFEEMLPKLLQQLTQMKMAEDADFQWIINLETQVIEKIQEPYQQAAQATAGPQPGPGAMGPPGAGPQMDPMMMQGAGGPMPQERGPMPGVNTAPAVDELRRMMAGPSAS